jgi:hypothetical protein
MKEQLAKRDKPEGFGRGRKSLPSWQVSSTMKSSNNMGLRSIPGDAVHFKSESKKIWKLGRLKAPRTY